MLQKPSRRLVRVAREDLTIVRQRRGKGFCYRDAEGRLICDKAEKTRLQSLGVPPAWNEVRYAADPRGHIQALGVDAAGRAQYIYHADWEKKRARRKHKRLSALTESLPRIRRRVSQDLTGEAGSKALALAIAVALIDRTAMRVGREKYLETSGTRGAGTLYTRDVTVEGDEVCLDFLAKGGKASQYCLNDARLAEAVTRIKTLPGKRLLVYRSETGKVLPIKTGAINDYLREISGQKISAKDFRTLHASSLAAEALARLEPETSEAGRKRQVTAVTREVAEFLHNTPMICRKSYIAPFLFELFEAGTLAERYAAEVAGKTGLRQREARLYAVIAALA